jgi:hypothetical protein
LGPPASHPRTLWLSNRHLSWNDNLESIKPYLIHVDAVYNKYKFHHVTKVIEYAIAEAKGTVYKVLREWDC